MASAIFYASSTGNTADVAKKIAKELGGISVFDIGVDGVDKIKEYDKIIIGTPTWGDGELQDDFEEMWDDFIELDFKNKTVALFGLGDQDSYGEYYLDAMGIIYQWVEKQGGKIVGEFPIGDEYYFEESKAVVDGKFVGLALDEDNQSEFTDSRIEQWCNDIKNEFL